jgi:hypothetical protein
VLLFGVATSAPAHAENLRKASWCWTSHKTGTVFASVRYSNNYGDVNVTDVYVDLHTNGGSFRSSRIQIIGYNINGITLFSYDRTGVTNVDYFPGSNAGARVYVQGWIDQTGDGWGSHSCSMNFNLP